MLHFMLMDMQTVTRHHPASSWRAQRQPYCHLSCPLFTAIVKHSTSVSHSPLVHSHHGRDLAFAIATTHHTLVPSSPQKQQPLVGNTAFFVIEPLLLPTSSSSRHYRANLTTHASSGPSHSRLSLPPQRDRSPCSASSLHCSPCWQ